MNANDRWIYIKLEAKKYNCVEAFSVRMKEIFKKANSATLRAGEAQRGMVAGKSKMNKAEQKIYGEYLDMLRNGEYNESNIWRKASA